MVRVRDYSDSWCLGQRAECRKPHAGIRAPSIASLPMFMTRHNLRLLAFGLVACLASSFGQTVFISLFNHLWQAEFDPGHGEIGTLYGSATLLGGLTLIHVGKLLDQVPLIRFTSLAVRAFAGSCLLLAWFRVSPGRWPARSAQMA